jgi:hypothetical protein
MKMARARADHASWRELIAARLDRPLTRSETRSLAAHLRACAACREADRDYRQQRALLRALPLRPVPRNLWPRTSAALDREVARGSSRFGRTWRRRGRKFGPSAALMATIASLGVVVGLTAMQLTPAVSIASPSVPAPATPFAIAPQQLAFVGSDDAHMYVYRTDVGHACPANAAGCAVDEGIVRTPVNLPASVRARNLALSPSGRTLALVGSGGGHDVIAVVLLSDGAHDPTPPEGTPAPVNPGATPVTVTGPGQPEATPSDAPPVVVAILENVESAGAPPAWSPSGEMLAFSAMPADGSHGPDVYVWSPSDAVARPVTTDHGSYFASWSTSNIVISRLAGVGNGEGSDGASLSTIVMDPSTSEERPVAGPALWLPVVNPAGTRAIAWRGDLDFASGHPVPSSGALLMIDWAAIDPFAAANEPVATPDVVETPTPTDAPAATDAPAPTDAPASTHPSDPPTAPPASPSASPVVASTEPAPSEGPSATPEPQSTETPVEPSETATPSALPDGWVELDLGRDTATTPVLDWQARWSLDGQVLGIWLADTVGSTWGRLAVMAVDPETGAVASSEALLSATLARRGFSLGLSRVVWVAPSDDNPDGELRIRTWGDDGVGGVRLEPLTLDGVVPAF